MTNTNEIRKEISKSLQRHCGMVCPNGMENMENQPSLNEIMQLLAKHENELANKVEPLLEQAYECGRLKHDKFHLIQIGIRLYELTKNSKGENHE